MTTPSIRETEASPPPSAANTADAATQPALWRATLAVFRKDVRSELRSRYALNALLLFAANSVVVQSLVLGLLLPSRNADLSLIYAALLWITVLFAAFTGLARAFVQEEETRTAAALRLAAPPLAVYLGKLLFNLVVLLLLDVVVTVLFVVLLRVEIGNLALFAALLGAGSLGLVAATTLIAAIIARAGARGALFAVLSFPLLVPLLVVAVQSTSRALDGVGWDVGLRPLGTLLAFATAQFVASLFLFPSVWEA